jgi:hypothetical protein
MLIGTAPEEYTHRIGIALAVRTLLRDTVFQICLF